MTNLLKKLALLIAIALAVLLYYRFQWQSLEAFATAIDSCDTIWCDFSRYYYPMGKKILDTHAPTDGFYYSPTVALIFSLWRFQEREAALVSWGAVQVVAAILMALIWMHSFQTKDFRLRLAYFLLILTSMPILHNFKWGQVSLIINLAVILALELYESNKKVAAAFSLAFATIFKFYPLIFLPYFILTGDFVFLLWFGVFLFILGLAVPAVFIGLKPAVSFYFAIFDTVGTRFTFVTGKLPGINAQYFPLVAMRYFGEFNNLAWLPPLQVISWLVFLANMFLVLWIIGSKVEHRLRWVFLITLASTPFYVSSAWAHYLVFLPAFQIFLAFAIRRDANMYWKYAILFASVVLSSVFLMLTFNAWSDYAYWGFMVVSNTLLLVLTYVEILPQLNLQETINYYKRFALRLIGKKDMT